MSETISRKAAIDALKQQAETMSEWSNRYAEQRKGVLTAVNIVEDIPSADEPSQVARDIARILENEQDMRVIAQSDKRTETHGVCLDAISRQAAIDAVQNRHMMLSKEKVLLINDLEKLPPAQPEIIRCKDCKHNPKYEWFVCPMSHLSEKQRPETAWCWKAERRTDE